LVNPFPTSPFIPQQQPNTNIESRPPIIYKNKKPATANNSHQKKKAIVYDVPLELVDGSQDEQQSRRPARGK
jgi:hypothetical protein